MKNDYSPVPMEEKLRQWEEDNHIASAGSYYVLMGMAQYYLGDHEKSDECLAAVCQYLSGLTDNVLKRQWYVFRVLNSLKRFEKGKGFASKEDLLTEIRPIIEKVETWARLGPLLRPYLAFLHAELERVTGDVREARGLYLDAIDLAHQQSYVFLEGQLNECLGELLLSAGQHPEKVFIVEAARLYRKCQAVRKETALMTKFPEYFEDVQAPHAQIEVETSSAQTLPDLDFEYLMKSSLAISSETGYDAVLKKIMNVVIESSGAQHGYLLMAEGGSLMIRAESHVTGKEAAKTFHQHLEDAGDICQVIVRFVYRTRERVILDRACQEGEFKDNREVQALQLRSVLCLPVVSQSKMIGILYLENRLSDGAFTAKKSQVTELLMLQAAICMENARLTDELAAISHVSSKLG